jgi:hypothetical protein
MELWVAGIRLKRKDGLRRPLLRTAKPANEDGLQGVCNLLGRSALKEYVEGRFRLLTKRTECSWLRPSHYWEALGIDAPKKTAELRSTVD